MAADGNDGKGREPTVARMERTGRKLDSLENWTGAGVSLATDLKA